MKNIALIFSLVLAVSTLRAQSSVSEATVDNKSNYHIEDPNGSKVPLGKLEVPEKVMNAFSYSVFQHTEIIQVFLLQDDALHEIVGSESTNQPQQLYEFQLRSGGKLFRQYFTVDGDLYEPQGAV